VAISVYRVTAGFSRKDFYAGSLIYFSLQPKYLSSYEKLRLALQDEEFGILEIV